MSRYYFSDHREDRCYTLEYFKILMKDEGIQELTVYEARMCTGEDFFFCKEFGEVGTVGEGCGKECSAYDPRNGKNGRCRHSVNCYEPDYSKSKVLRI